MHFSKVNFWNTISRIEVQSQPSSYWQLWAAPLWLCYTCNSKYHEHWYGGILSFRQRTTVFTISNQTARFAELIVQHLAFELPNLVCVNLSLCQYLPGVSKLVEIYLAWKLIARVNPLRFWQKSKYFLQKWDFLQCFLHNMQYTWFTIYHIQDFSSPIFSPSSEKDWNFRDFESKCYILSVFDFVRSRYTF